MEIIASVGMFVKDNTKHHIQREVTPPLLRTKYHRKATPGV